MKPKNNRVMCPDCGKQKMLFESESKANNFIKWNASDIDSRGGVLRSYYCPSCCGWHISHKVYRKNYDKNTDMLINAYNRDLTYRKKFKKNESLDKSSSSESSYNNLSSIDIARKVYDEEIPDEIKCGSKRSIKCWVTNWLQGKNFTQLSESLIRYYIYKLCRNKGIIL